MLQQKTVLVVGAGASFDFGLPLGNELKKRISAALRFQTEFSRPGATSNVISDQIKRYCVLKEIRNQVGEYFDCAASLSKGVVVSDSIDEYVERAGSEKIKVLAKMAISRLILEGERSSLLWFDKSNTRNSINFEFVNENGSWIQKLFSKLRSGVATDNIDTVFDNFEVISFNYDRCIEHYFFHAIRAFWNLTFEQADFIIKKLNIIYPYGKVGEYLPADHLYRAGAVGFGDLDKNVCDIFENIDTYSEYRSSKTLDNIRESLNGVEKIIFLGCHYHKQNLDVLSVAEIKSHPSIYGTVLGYTTDEDIDAIRFELSGRFSTDAGKIRLSPVKSFNLFENYQRLMII